MITTSATGIQQWQVIRIHVNSQRVIAHGLGKAGYFVNRLSLHSKSGDQRTNLGIGDLTGHDGIHRRRSFSPVQFLPVHNRLNDLLDVDMLFWFGGHAVSDLIPVRDEYFPNASIPKNRDDFRLVYRRAAHPQEIEQQVISHHGQDRFRMKLHSFQRVFLMAHPLDDAVR